MFWERFYNLCISRGTKPNPVGKEIGISSGIISKWKTGAIPSGEMLIKISEYLDCSIDYLLGRSDKIKSNDDSGYDQLDDIDKAEIRGMIRQMLKADKYQKTPTYTIPVAARGPLSEDAVLTDEEKAAADAKHPDLA